MLLDKLKDVEKRYDELSTLLSDPKIISDQNLFKKYAKEHSSIADTVEVTRKLRVVIDDMTEYKSYLDGKDEELKMMAKEDLPGLEEEKEALEEKLKVLLIPKDPNDDKSVIVEIRAGAGGDESTLFAAELFRMYSRYAETQNWKIDILNSNPTGLDGYKEIIFMVEGFGAYSRLKFESGVHRVQRVPETESSGRRHTSTVTVAVMPEAEAVEVDVSPDEIRVDTYRAGGHGGQAVNKLETAIRITHLPTNTVVTCQDEKSQHKNRAKAMKVLLARLYDKKMQEQQDELSKDRKTQVGSGDRSEKIRTYNFPQNRVSDHRINLTLYKLNEIMEGDLTELTDSVIHYFQAEALKGDAS